MLVWKLLERSKLIRVFVIALVEYWCRSSTILLHCLHLHHCVILLLNLLLLRTQNLLLRMLWDARHNWWLSWSGRLIICLLVRIPMKCCVSSLSDVSSLDLEVTRNLEISRTLAIGALRKRVFFRVEAVRFIYDWVDNTATTAWIGTWIIKENYFCKRGTTES